jgi:hypothetical protein
MNKQAISPVEMGGLLAGGKIMASNAIHRFGDRIPGIARLGKEIAGVGARTAMQGKPMVSPVLRHAASILGDPHMVSVYENAHRAGSVIPKGTSSAQVKGMIGQLIHNPDIAGLHPGLGKLLSGPAAKFVEGVPLESKGIRKVIDYGFTPVSQVAKDIKSGVGRLMPRKNALQEGVSYLPPGAQAA